MSPQDCFLAASRLRDRELQNRCDALLRLSMRGSGWSEQVSNASQLLEAALQSHAERVDATLAMLAERARGPIADPPIEPMPPVAPRFATEDVTDVSFREVSGDRSGDR